MSIAPRRYLLGGMLAVVLALMALTAFSLNRSESSASSGDWLEYPWSPAEQAQRELAIEQRDPSLLPACADDYFRWREETKPPREAMGGAPFTMDFWEAPECNGKPDGVILGPDRHSERRQLWERDSTPRPPR